MSDDSMPWLYPGLDRYTDLLARWVQHELTAAYGEAVLPDGQQRLCLGILVFGGYVRRFLDVCLPSLMADGNLPALNDPLLIIHTDEKSVSTLEAGLTDLRAIARVEIHVVPQPVIDATAEHPNNKYWLLGGAHNLEIQQARYRGHAYHMLMPDHVYATGYFAGVQRLAREGKHAIVQCNISAQLEAVAPVLAAAGGTMASADLAALAIDHMHPLAARFLLNGHDDWPGSPFVLMVGEREARIVCPHMSIVYMSHDLLMRAPLRLFSTIDGQLPYFIPADIEPYVPTPADGMTMIEVSDKDKFNYPSQRTPISTFAALFWFTVFFEESHLRFFDLTTVCPLPAGYVPPMPAFTAAQMDAKAATVRNAVRRARASIYDLAPDQYRGDPLDRILKDAA